MIYDICEDLNYRCIYADAECNGPLCDPNLNVCTDCCRIFCELLDYGNQRARQIDDVINKRSVQREDLPYDSFG